MGQGPEVMNREEIEQVARMLHEMGFKVEWVDAEAETFLVRVMSARR